MLRGQLGDARVEELLELARILAVARIGVAAQELLDDSLGRLARFPTTLAGSPPSIEHEPVRDRSQIRVEAVFAAVFELVDLLEQLDVRVVDDVFDVERVTPARAAPDQHVAKQPIAIAQHERVARHSIAAAKSREEPARFPGTLARRRFVECGARRRLGALGRVASRGASVAMPRGRCGARCRREQGRARVIVVRTEVHELWKSDEWVTATVEELAARAVPSDG
jgi:hypothetical protein